MRLVKSLLLGLFIRATAIGAGALLTAAFLIDRLDDLAERIGGPAGSAVAVALFAVSAGLLQMLAELMLEEVVG